MGDRSLIEWTDATWNPVRGCTRVSEGCRNCYAERVAARFSGPGMPYEGLAAMRAGEPRWTGELRVVETHLEDPLRWRNPRRVFVNSMSDLFHEKLHFEDIGRVFGVMAACPHHSFQILTKRPERMREFVTITTGIPGRPHWPLPNVWLGVSVENQPAADERIPELLATPAAVRFVSAEPLLGPIDFDQENGLNAFGCGFEGGWRNCPENSPKCAGLDWVIVGGESGPGARPMHPRWARTIRDQCVAAGVPFFFKQWGEWRGCYPGDGWEPSDDMLYHYFEGGPKVWRVGKKRAGRLLDGRTWDEMPRGKS